jgi:peptidoglycan hydrolase-like protein with peptidoglycan-binding domain
MIKSKVLNDSAWKDVLAKNKGIKDNGLLKTLTEIKKLGDDDHDDAHSILDQVQKLITQLKKSKEVAAAPDVGKFLGELTSATDTAVRDVAKAKAEADKSTKAKAEADKKAKAASDKKGDEDEDGDEEESPELLTTKLKPLLRMVAKGERMHALLAKSGKQVVVMLSRKPIPPARRKMLADQLGGGSTKYFPGHCHLEAGATTFVLKAEVAGMSKLIKLALLEQTGLRLNKIKCRGEDGDDEGDDDDEGGAPDPKAKGKNDDDDEDDAGDDASGAASEKKGAQTEDLTGMVRPFEIGAAVGQGGKNLEEDVQAVQAALNRRAGAGLKVDGRCSKDTIEAIMEFQRAMGLSKPDGRVDPGRGTARALAASGKIGKPPPPPNPKAPPPDLGAATLARAPEIWHGTRELLDHNIKELKRAIKQEYANEHPSLLAEIDQNVQRVDVILQKLDTRLAQTLERAGATQDAAKRKAEIANAKTILADYVAFVKSEPLIDHIDKNPFGVNAQVKKTITNSLTHMIKSIA